MVKRNQEYWNHSFCLIYSNASSFNLQNNLKNTGKGMTDVAIKQVIEDFLDFDLTAWKIYTN